MADRYPLVVDGSNYRIEEIPNGDDLNLSGSDINNVVNITASGSVRTGLGTESSVAIGRSDSVNNGIIFQDGTNYFISTAVPDKGTTFVVDGTRQLSITKHGKVMVGVGSTTFFQDASAFDSYPVGDLFFANPSGSNKYSSALTVVGAGITDQSGSSSALCDGRIILSNPLTHKEVEVALNAGVSPTVGRIYFYAPGNSFEAGDPGNYDYPHYLRSEIVSAGATVGIMTNGYGSRLIIQGKRAYYAAGAGDQFILNSKMRIQVGNYADGSTEGSEAHYFYNSGITTSNVNICAIGGAVGSAWFYSVANVGAAVTGGFVSASLGEYQTILSIKKNDTSGRSIYAQGTVITSGSDYAEYMIKSGDFTIAKGDIVGVNADGKLTNKFSESVSFVVKSTDPSYVGGGKYEYTTTNPHPGEYPSKVEDKYNAADVLIEAGETEEEYQQRVSDWQAAMELWKADQASNIVAQDRIAFSGIVPVNVTGATPGQYIVPVLGASDSISGVAKDKSALTMEEYFDSIGKVVSVGDDGRASIIVKVA